MASALTQLFAHDVPVKPVVVAALLGLVARRIMKSVCRPWAEGPNLYWVRHSDVGGPWLRWILLGASAVHNAWPAGVAHRTFTRRAREEKGRHVAHAAYRMGPIDRVQLTNPEDVKYVLHGESAKDFIKSPFVKVVASILGHNGLVLLTDEAEHTRQFRNVSHAFAPAAVRAISETTLAEKTHQAAVALDSEVEAEGGSERVVHRWLTDTALEIILEAAFGITDVRKYPAAVEFSQHLDLKPSILMLLPPWLFLALPLQRHRDDAKARANLKKAIDPLLEEKRRAAQARAAKSGEEEERASRNKKLIDMLAENPSLSDLEILDHSSTFVMAGHETTANGTNWLMYMLAKHPEVQETLAEELASAFARDAVPSLDTLQQLPYLNAVVNESLRLRAPALVFSRYSEHNDHILPGSGTYIPAGTILIFDNASLHTDPTVWGADAEEFRPERWIDDPELKQRVQGSSYLPFASGKRACIGKELAVNEMLTMTAALVRRFVLSWPEGQPEPQGLTGPVIRPKEPFKLRLARRPE